MPTARPASWLTNLITLAASTGILLVVLCSRQAKVEQVAERVSKHRGARALVVDVPDDYRIPDAPMGTSNSTFAEASGKRESDLSLKRNLGLLIARRHGWLKIAFVDDDITLPRAALSRMATQLDENVVVGMVSRDFPDNSVVCHARRLAGLKQDNFVTGAALGVMCGDLPLPYFPDIYNEDWFSFSRSALGRSLPAVGNAVQAEYDPFDEERRAVREEFGDLLAEGMYSLFKKASPDADLHKLLSKAASNDFWSHFIETRSHLLAETVGLLDELPHERDRRDRIYNATTSLRAAQRQLREITPELCEWFIDEWLQDMEAWKQLCERVDVLRSTWDVMRAVGAANWRVAEFGSPDLPTAQVPLLVGT